MSKYQCTICGYVYDEASGIPDAGIAAGTKWEELPEGWTCPICGAPKSVFKRVPEKSEQAEPARRAVPPPAPAPHGDGEALRELSCVELSALCSNLAKGCEKQYLAEEAGLFGKLADYFCAHAAPLSGGGTGELLERIERSLAEDYPQATEAANSAGPDRGALRALVWSEKVSRMLASLLERYEKEGPGFLVHTNVYVCEICGFVYVGDEPPEICPVCKVPKLKIACLSQKTAV